MLESLKKAVCQANLDLVKEGLVVQTWGNASGLDRARGLMVIKPSGVSYSVLRPAHMVVIDLADGQVVEGYASIQLFGTCARYQRLCDEGCHFLSQQQLL